MESWSLKSHPRPPSQAEGGGEVERYVFSVLTSSSQGFPMIGFLVLPAARKAPQPTSEELALTGRGQVTSHVPNLGPFYTLASPVHFLELGLRALMLFCQAVLVT